MALIFGHYDKWHASIFNCFIVANVCESHSNGIYLEDLKLQEAHGPHRSPEQQFLVTLHFVAYAFSILNIEPLSGDPVMVRGLWLA